MNRIILCSPAESIAFSYEVVCPETWVKFRGSCYSFKSVMLEMNLEEARDHCRKTGTVICTVNSFRWGAEALLIISMCFYQYTSIVFFSFRKFFRRSDSSG